VLDVAMPKVRLQGARIVALVRTRVAAGVPQHVRKKQKTIEALVRQIEILVRQQPVLMIFEDAHWIDPSSRELLDTTIERVARLPVLLVITFRPEFHPPWTGQAHVTTISLSRLGRREGCRFGGIGGRKQCATREHYRGDH
jgi:hypothetical protein